jgi:hypothetical protein
MHGEEGGEVNASTPMVESWFEKVGARPRSSAQERPMSLDGHVTGPDVTPQEPMGRGDERLHATRRRNRCVDYDPGR